jgi:hypothetical protein
MMLPLTFRTIVLTGTVLSILFLVMIYRSTKEKTDYDQLSGKITYLNERLGNLPYRDLGRYRYLKIDGYQYPFEIYADDQAPLMDSLKTGDMITIYFYQTNNTIEEGINRFTQFIEKGDKLYFKRGNFIIGLSITMIIFMISLSVWCYFLYKRGKIPY